MPNQISNKTAQLGINLNINNLPTNS